MYSSLPYSMLVWPLPPLYLPPPYVALPEPSRAELPAPGAYRIDPDASSVGFAVRELGVVPVRGRFTGVTGGFDLAGRGDRVTVSAEVAVPTLRTGIAKRDADLLGPRFLNAVEHPMLRFTATRLGTDQGAWVVPGRLEVRGFSRPVALRLDPARRTADGAVQIRAIAWVNRRDFGIRVPRAIIGRHARIDVEITARAVTHGTHLPAPAPMPEHVCGDQVVGAVPGHGGVS